MAMSNIETSLPKRTKNKTRQTKNTETLRKPNRKAT